MKTPTVLFDRKVPDTRIIGETSQGRPLHLLQEHVRYCINGQVLDIQPGYVTDLGSAPRFSWPFFLPSELKLIMCYILHDMCYAAELFPRKLNDLIFLGAMRHMGVKPWRRAIIYAAVRIGGGFTYKEHSNYLIKSNRSHIGIPLAPGEVKKPLWENLAFSI